MKIKALITGASGMVGHGILLECLDSPEVESVLVVNRRSIGITHKKLKEIIVQDFFALSGIENELSGYNACFFSLGISSAGLGETEYNRITYDLTMNFAKTVLQKNDDLTFCYVSGLGTDSSEKGRTMWARVKGKTENALLKMPFKAAYMFRPGYIQPMKGVKSRTCIYQFMYNVFGFLFPIWNALFPNFVTTTERVGQAMLNVVRENPGSQILETRDINRIASKEIPS
ncbi:MAG: epimerase [Deferribacteres bacterium]|nr:epimerase [candidate division KSB1 bacterium]MCB9503944.1 epimerase [Deferribacteres bacterium]